MKFFSLVLLFFLSTEAIGQASVDTIDVAGSVAIDKKLKNIVVDSNVTSIKLTDPKPKIANNFIYTSGKIRYRIILYTNGVYTKTRI